MSVRNYHDYGHLLKHVIVHPTNHNVSAKWLKKLEKDLKDIEKQDDILVDSAKVRAQLRKVPDWKSPDPDGLQGYWLKNFTSCVDRIAKHQDGKSKNKFSYNR